MSYLKPNTAGVYDIPSLNASRQLYVRGLPFETYIGQLEGVDQFEQSEVDELKLLVQYLNTSGLSSEWIVDNQNKNQDLKSLITALETKLANIDTTALSQTSVLTNDNRNSVLKSRLDTTDSSLTDLTSQLAVTDASLNTLTGNLAVTDASLNTLKGRVDGHDGTLATLNSRTQYLTSGVGDDNTDPRHPSYLQIGVFDRQKRLIRLSTGACSFNLINDSLTQLDTAYYTDNSITFGCLSGMIQSTSYIQKIQADIIELSAITGFGVQSDSTIKIGQGGSLIEIGSIDTPEIGWTNTRIYIGKRSLTKNTATHIRGNVYIGDSRFEGMAVTNAFTWANLIALIPTNGLPLWVASAILTSAIPNFVYSDLWAMKGTTTKDGDVETTTGAKLKSLTIYDPEITIDILPKVTTFLAKGDISETTLWGSIRQQTFNGEILLRNNNIASTNIDWLLTDSMDKVNALKISNNDIELIAGAGALNSEIRISNTTKGPIRFRSGTATGLQANAHDAMKILGDQASTQVVIAGNNSPSGYDTTSKLLVDHQNLANGIKVTNHQDALITRIDYNNVNTPSLTLQTNFTGTTTKSLYLNSSDKLMYAGAEVTPVTGITAGQNITINNNNGNYTINSQGGVNGGSGLIYILVGPTADAVYTGANFVTQTLTATDVYTADGQKSIKLTSYSAATTYNLVIHRGLINLTANPILKGTYEYVPYITYFANVAADIYCDLYFYATAGSNGLMSKLTFTNVISTGFIHVGEYAQTGTWDVSLYQFEFKFTDIEFPNINYLGSNVVIRCQLIDDAASVLYTFPDVTKTSASNGTVLSIASITFTAGTTQTITQGFLYTGKKLRWKVSVVSGSAGCYFSQPTSGGVNSMAFRISSGTYTTPLALNTSNPTALDYTTAFMKQYELLFSLNEFDLSMFPLNAPYFETRLNFVQPSGATNNHYVEVFFNDGSLSHVHTALNSSTTTPSLYQTMLASRLMPDNISSTNGIGIHMGGGSIQGIGTLVDNNGLAYNVKSIVAGTGVTVSNNGGAVTVSSTGGGNTVHNLYWTGANNKVTFTLPSSVNLIANKVRGVFRLTLRGGGTNASINYPLFLMNNTHTYPTSNATQNQYTQYRRQSTTNSYPMPNYADVYLVPAAGGNGGMSVYDSFQEAETISGLSALANTGTSFFLNIHFEVSMAYDVHTDSKRSFLAHGECHLIHRDPGGSLGRFEKWNFVREHAYSDTTALTHLGFASYSTMTGGSIYGANLLYEVVPYGSAVQQTGAGTN